MWGLVLAVWAVYRATIGVDAPIYFDELIFKPLLFIGPVLFYIHHFERRDALEALWCNTSGLWHQVRAGVLISLPVLGLLLVRMVGMGGAGLGAMLSILPVALGMTLSEEILSRGFVARHLYEESKSVIRTVIQASLMHMFLRIPRIMTSPDLVGDKLILFALGDLALSFVLTGIFLWRKSLFPVLVVRVLCTLLLMTAVM